MCVCIYGICLVSRHQTTPPPFWGGVVWRCVSMRIKISSTVCKILIMCKIIHLLPWYHVPQVIGTVYSYRTFFASDSDGVDPVSVHSTQWSHTHIVLQECCIHMFMYTHDLQHIPESVFRVSRRAEKLVLLEHLV